MHGPIPTRRDFLSGIVGSAGALCCCRGLAGSTTADDVNPAAADVTLRIAPVQLEIARGRTIKTVGYNGSVPGPIVRFREGVAATIDIFNDTDAPELVHWHGFDVPPELDGAEEENSLAVAAHGHLRYRLTPTPAGFRYVHTHAMAMGDLSRGTFSGQFAFAWIEPKSKPGRYDQEIFLATHEWDPYKTSTDEDEEDENHPHPDTAVGNGKEPHEWEVDYRYYTINGKCLGFGEPIRVKEGQHVLFHFLNASATKSVRLALPGHQFQVVALDGNPVPQPKLVNVVELGTAERVDAVVAMNNPGVFVLGSTRDRARGKGMGIVVEYAGRKGTPQWIKPPGSAWDYALFGENRAAQQPDTVMPLIFREGPRQKATFEQWTINGKGYDSRATATPLFLGKRHRLVFDNQTDDAHPIHLHRCGFELLNGSGGTGSGIIKDVVVVKGHKAVQVDVVPLTKGLTLFHCHQQVHMDNGFKLLFDIV
jgi:FtsP/CotA-like multicopper oxidase with cupredoxin domain